MTTQFAHVYIERNVSYRILPCSVFNLYMSESDQDLKQDMCQDVQQYNYSDIDLILDSREWFLTLNVLLC